ncbi:class I SAM-dependent methyltransferase [Actinopolymorpha sp. B11F2]|uniref:class I SAM-dependent methyltransferase n=1 Tax=Actinopolymorpha sp. B11F2 TaxID=3160862 RepID=UPI0032E4569A
MDGPKIGDAFGELLLATYAGRSGYGAIERNDGLLAPHAGEIYFTGSADWSDLERAACDRSTGRVLDAGCGAGRHSLYLQERGLDVTAIDPSPGACQVARARGVRKVHQVCLEELPVLGERFDTFLLLGNNLALLGTPEHADVVLDALARSATPNAQVLGGCRDPYVTDDPDHLDYHSHNRRHGRAGGQTRLRSRFGRLADPWFDYLFCSRDELARWTEHSPWRLTGVDEEGPGYLAELRLR